MAEEKGQQRDNDEIETTSKVRQFVQMQQGVHGEEHQLQADYDDGANGEMIQAQNVNGHCSRGCRESLFLNESVFLSCCKSANRLTATSFQSVPTVCAYPVPVPFPVYMSRSKVVVAARQEVSICCLIGFLCISVKCNKSNAIY